MGKIAWVGIGLMALLASPALGQEVTVDVTVIGVQPGSRAEGQPGPISIGSIPGLALSRPDLGAAFNRETCGGIGDPLQQGLERFNQLTEQRARATTPIEQARLDREIVEQGLRLPALVNEDFGRRNLALGQSDACDNLIQAVTEVMRQVADYLGALRDARTAVIW